MADEKEQQLNQAKESEPTEFLSDESEPLVPLEPQKDDEAGPDIPNEPKVQEQKKPELPQKLKDEPKQIGAPISRHFDKLKTFYVECKRVLRVTKKPNRDEFQTIVKVSAIGMAIIGVIGFLVHFIKEFFF